MSEETFSYRWGIKLLDDHFTSVPNVFFRHYAQAGVARHEFLLLLHLASYKYESKNGECRPSLATVAREMGYSGERGLQKTLGDLEERGLLRRHYRQGKTTIYDFSGFSRAVLAAARRTAQDELEDTPELQYTPPPNSSTPPPPNSSAPEEQEEKKKTKNNTATDAERPSQCEPSGDRVVGGLDSLSEHHGEAVDALESIGVSGARGLVRQYGNSESGLKRVMRCARYARREWEGERCKNPAGLAVSLIKGEKEPPERGGEVPSRREFQVVRADESG